MHTTVLLLDEGTALAFVGVVAIVAVCLVALALVAIVFVAWNRSERHAAAAAPSSAAPTPVTFHLPRATAVRTRGSAAVKNVEIDVPTRHADAIIHALQASGWSVRDTGEVVATDDDEEGLTTISVDVPSDAPTSVSRPGSGEEIR
jgi:hypothetical protein